MKPCAGELPRRTRSDSFPIIVQTSLTAREHRNWSGEITNLLFMEKPISVRRLMFEIDKLLKGNGTDG